MWGTAGNIIQQRGYILTVFTPLSLPCHVSVPTHDTYCTLYHLPTYSAPHYTHMTPRLIIPTHAQLLPHSPSSSHTRPATAPPVLQVWVLCLVVSLRMHLSYAYQCVYTSLGLRYACEIVCLEMYTVYTVPLVFCFLNEFIYNNVVLPSVCTWYSAGNARNMFNIMTGVCIID